MIWLLAIFAAIAFWQSKVKLALWIAVAGFVLIPLLFAVGTWYVEKKSAGQ